MGFFDSFSSGVSSFFGGVGDVFSSFAGSPIGSNFLTTTLEFGLGELADVIGITPSVRNDQRGAPAGPLGRPTVGPSFSGMSISEFCRSFPQSEVCRIAGVAPAPQRGSMMLPRTDTLPFEGQLGTVRPPIPQPGVGGLRPQLGVPVPFIPSSQPFGEMPGTRSVNFGGVTRMPAFPVSTQQGFPPTGFSGIFNQATPLFQQAAFGGLAAPLLRQLPGIVGGFLGGAALDAATSGGGGMTPMFRPTMAGVRAQSFRATNPVTGQDVFFRPAGKPILWSSDLSACKRVNKVARRARRKR